MNVFILALFTFVLCAEFAVSQKFAYVSVLSSNDFLIPAKVLAYRLKKLNPSIPFVIVVTQDITEKSIKELENQGVTVRNDSKIDTPYIKTHSAKKYQYTKIRLWKMTEFDMIVHLDLDVLPTRDISSLFECGSFCAVFRHSDMFNSGVFVLKTDEKIFHDMTTKVQSAVSYDGGDQGFLNTYFHELKYAPMYEPTRKETYCHNYTMKRLSSKFNYDIGMYYLNNGRFLVEPDIIHYTMGPTKPWLWWTYPIFDLNWIWLEARQEMEHGSNEQFDTCIALAAVNCVLIVVLFILKKALEMFVCNWKTHSLSKKETHIIANGIFLVSLYISLKLAFQAANPVSAWIFFSSNTAWTAAILTSIYTRIRTGVDVKFRLIAYCVFFTMICHASFWLVLIQLSHFNTRVFTSIFFILAQHLLIVNFIRHALILKPYHYQHKYQIIENNNHCA